MPKKKIIGAAYQDLKSIVKEHSQKDLPVLFIGETGCGKEVFINYYFEASRRSGKKKMTVNCAGVPDTILESDLFGLIRGAFTGANKERPGMIRACNKGILCLDELGDASEHLQAAILRVSEGGSFKPLGSDEIVTANEYNTLIIAATNKPDKIREEIYYRFHTLPIPPLQEFDIPELAMHFLGNPLNEDVLKELMARSYPGNVRELKKCCERLELERGECGCTNSNKMELQTCPRRI